MDTPGVKQPSPPVKNCTLSLSYQTLILTVIALAVGAAFAVLTASYAVNGMKNMLVEQSRQEALTAAQFVVDDIAGELAASPADSLRAIVEYPEIQKRLENLVALGEISMVSIRDAEGSDIFSCFCHDSMTKKECELAVEETLAPNGPSEDLPIVSVSRPIIRDGDLIGQVVMGYSREVTNARVARLSSAITMSLGLLSATVLLVLLATIAMLWRLSCRNVSLAERNAESEHLANLGVLASGLAHEIRNPLSAMKLHLEVVKEDLEDEEPSGTMRQESVETLESVQRQIDRLNGIVSNFVNLSLPIQMNPQPMNLEELVREVVTFMKPEFEKHDIRVEVDVNEEMRIDGDSEALYQVLMNLLINARQALEKVEDKKIKIRGYLCKKGKQGWAVAVEDSGPGIPQGSEEQVFRQFVAKRNGGTGFGLSLARHIVSGHGGTIIAERSPELGGARIAIKFVK